MFFTQPTYGFTSGYPKSYVFDGNMLCSSYVQSYLGVYPSILGGWYTSAPNSEVSPWAWQWNERVGIQGVCAAFRSPKTQYTKRVSL